MEINFTVILLAIIGIFLLVLIIIAGGKNSKQPEWKSIAKNKLWNTEKLLDSMNYYQVKTALIDLDKLLDYILKSKHVKGNTLGERLKNSKHLFNKSDYNYIWQAHKLRNELVHEINNTQSIGNIKQNSYRLVNIIKNIIN